MKSILVLALILFTFFARPAVAGGMNSGGGTDDRRLQEQFGDIDPDQAAQRRWDRADPFNDRNGGDRWRDGALGSDEPDAGNHN